MNHASHSLRGTCIIKLKVFFVNFVSKKIPPQESCGGIMSLLLNRKPSKFFQVLECCQ
jgi:hypothetical protein